MRNLKYYDYNTKFFFYNANMLLTNMYLVYTKCHMPRDFQPFSHKSSQQPMDEVLPTFCG